MSTIGTDGLRNCPTLSSKHLRFKPLREEDLPSIVDLLSDYETVLLLTYAPWPYTLQDAMIWLNQVNRMCEAGIGCFWGIYNRENRFIGTTGLSLFPEHEKAELHYWLGKPYWGKGYGTETARFIMDHSFRKIGIKRLEVNHMACNFRSQHVIEKCGFKFEGFLRSYIKRFGNFEDIKIYSLLREEFEQKSIKS